MESTLIVALTGLITGILAGIGTLYIAIKNGRQVAADAKRTEVLAKKDEVELLRAEVTRLQSRLDKYVGENDAMHERINELRDNVTELETKYEREHEYTVRLRSYISQLTQMMRVAGLTPPPMPEPLGDDKSKT
jgi:predicted nuclease with TOPRIM domain